MKSAFLRHVLSPLSSFQGLLEVGNSGWLGGFMLSGTQALSLTYSSANYFMTQDDCLSTSHVI